MLRAFCAQKMSLSDQDVAYLVGKNGATRMRLEAFSGCRLFIDGNCAEVDGPPRQRELAKLAIAITLQQRDGGSVTIDFDDLEDREDVSTFDVPKETVGFLLGQKGRTLREMETKHRVFMFFNNDRERQGIHGPCKRLYVIGNDADRNEALDEAEDVVRFKLTGESMRGRPGGPPSRYDDRGQPPRCALADSPVASPSPAHRQRVTSPLFVRRQPVAGLSPACRQLVASQPAAGCWLPTDRLPAARSLHPAGADPMG